MGEIIKVPDILVYKGGALYSLRDQKICKNGTLQNFAPGCGVVKGKNLYVLDESEERVPIVTMVTAKQSVSFTVDKTSDIEVDWGDSITEANVFSHTYTDGLEHTIRFYGSVTALTKLYCQLNQLSSLNISGCATLKILACHDNQLSSLDVIGCAALIGLLCGSNQLQSLDVSGCVVLRDLECQLNQLQSLDVSGCATLTRLICLSNQLLSLDVSGCIALTELSCFTNPFISDNTQMMNVANSLPDRSGKSMGTLTISNPNAQADIQSVCDRKNWSIS